MSVIKFINDNLPGRIVIGKYEFEFQIFKNAKDDIRTGYLLVSTMCDSWCNPFEENKLCDYLICSENVATDNQMMDALEKINAFLKTNKLK